MATERIHRKARISISAAAFVLALLVMSFCSYSYSQQGPNIIYAKNDTDFSIRAAALSGSSGAKQRKSVSENSTDRRLLVVYDSDPDCSQLEGLTDAVFSKRGLCVMQFDSAENAQNAYDEMQGWDQIRSVEFDSLINAAEDTDSAAGSSGHLSWGASCIGADEYASYIDSIDHGQLTLAIVDSGIDPAHPLFESRLTDGYDFIDNDPDPDDGYGHGTHLAGIVADCTPGMADIMIMPVKVLNYNGDGTISLTVSGILYAADNGASVINLSLGGLHSSYLDNAVKQVIADGAVVVAASGNDGKDIDRSLTCPAHIEEVITVGSVNESMLVEKTSNYGKKLDVVAPGEDIRSAYPGGSYITYSGTSMAAAHVSACAALLKLRYPGLGCTQISSVIKRSCNSYEDTAHYGSGVVDLRNLIADISAQDLAPKLKNVVYTGQPVKDRIIVSRNSEKLSADDFTVTCRNNTSIGTATAVVTGQGSYSGTAEVSFNIIPKKIYLKQLKAERQGFTAKWNKGSKITAYQLQYATDSKFTAGKTTKTITKISTVSKKITGLKAGKKYYVRIRAYKTVGDKRYYSTWSKTQTVTTKK